MTCRYMLRIARGAGGIDLTALLTFDRARSTWRSGGSGLARELAMRAGLVLVQRTSIQGGLTLAHPRSSVRNKHWHAS